MSKAEQTLYRFSALISACLCLRVESAQSLDRWLLFGSGLLVWSSYRCWWCEVRHLVVIYKRLNAHSLHLCLIQLTHSCVSYMKQGKTVKSFSYLWWILDDFGSVIYVRVCTWRRKASDQRKKHIQQLHTLHIYVLYKILHIKCSYII